MKRLLVLICVLVVLTVLAVGAGTASADGVNPTACQTLSQNGLGYGPVYDSLCRNWTNPAP